MIKLSIIVPVYNHEKYIEQAIRSILQQKVKFNYEVIIGEDCSKDKSKDILKCLEKECPSNFQFYYREKNMGARRNIRDLYSRMCGEYFIVLEGDDYWIDSEKLQKQVDFLDSNKEYIACAHRVKVVDKDSNELHVKYPECEKREYSIFDYENLTFPGQTSTVMSRNYITYDLFDTSLLNVKYYAGDQRKYFMLAANGRVYCFPNYWSAYRYNNMSGDSFSAKIHESIDIYQQDIAFRKALIKYSIKIGNSDARKVAEALYILSVYGYVKYAHLESGNQILYDEFVHCKYKVHIVLFLIKFFWNHKIKKSYDRL